MAKENKKTSILSDKQRIGLGERLQAFINDQDNKYLSEYLNKSDAAKLEKVIIEKYSQDNLARSLNSDDSKKVTAKLFDIWKDLEHIVPMTFGPLIQKYGLNFKRSDRSVLSNSNPELLNEHFIEEMIECCVAVRYMMTHTEFNTVAFLDMLSECFDCYFAATEYLINDNINVAITYKNNEILKFWLFNPFRGIDINVIFDLLLYKYGVSKGRHDFKNYKPSYVIKYIEMMDLLIQDKITISKEYV